MPPAPWFAMKVSAVEAPLGGRALLAALAALAVAGCTGVIDAPYTPEMDAPGSEAPGGGGGGEAEPGEQGNGEDAPIEVGDDENYPCTIGGSGVYTPFGADGGFPSGPVDGLPWTGVAPIGALGAYPAGAEDFSGYGTELPEIVECSEEKTLRSHLDVTAGCLEAVTIGSEAYTRGQVHTNGDGYFRALALGYTPGESDHPIKWTDQGIEYRFLHHGRTDTAGNPGFKAFARYRSENDLFVASWRFDGVVQIQSKVCGEYEALAVLDDFGPPSPDVWHSLRFEAIGDELNLYLDDELVLTATSSVLSWGTAGIRIDSADDAYLDDWAIYQP